MHLKCKCKPILEWLITLKSHKPWFVRAVDGVCWKPHTVEMDSIRLHLFVLITRAVPIEQELINMDEGV